MIIGSSLITISQRWTDLKKTAAMRRVTLHYEETSSLYDIVAIDAPLVFVTRIYRGTVPDGVLPDYSQAQNDADKADFEANHKATANMPLDPRTSDGKRVFLPNLFPGPVLVYLAGSGDTADDIAAGQAFTATSDSATPEDVTVEWTFRDWLYIAGGELLFSGAALGDHVSYEVFAPATTVTPNGGGTGNCNLAGPGNVLIVPAAGNGTHDVDLDQANLVPSFDEDDGGSPTGYWDWDEPDTGRGTITAGATPGEADFNLYTVDVDLTQPVGRLHLLGSGYLPLIVGAVKPKKLLPHWKHRATLHNSGHVGAVSLSWMLWTGRKKTV